MSHAIDVSALCTATGTGFANSACWGLALLLSAAALAPETTFAQSPNPPPFPEERPPFVIMNAREAFESRTVTGLPYAAHTETEIVQTLVDGNRIVHKTGGFVARDSAGRTRREQSVSAVGALFGRADSPRIVALVDPVEGVAFFLDEHARLAHRRPLRDGALPPIMPPSSRGQVRHAAPAEEAVETSLGTRIEGGLRLDGVRRTITTPAGAIGNEKPIVTTVERWYSPELQVLVSTVHDDPRIGEIRFRLLDIVEAEPDSALFRIPEGYEIVVGPPRRRGWGQPPPGSAAPVHGPVP